MATDSDILKDAREQFKEADEAWNDNRIAYLEDLKFARLAEQWPAEVKDKRDQEQRPCLTINKLPAFIRQVVNDARQNKPAIKVHPVDDSADPQTAEIMNGLIRSIEYSSNADIAYDVALEAAVTGGFGYFRIKTDYAHDDTFDLDILIDPIANPLTVFGDPRSKAFDSSDWNVAFVTELIRKGEFERKYKGAKKVAWDGDGYDQLDEQWMSGEDVRLAEYWTREEVASKIVKLSTGEILPADHYMREDVRALFDAMGAQVVGERPVMSWKVIQRILTGAEVLETNDWPGHYIPIIPVYGDEVNVEGVRHFRSLVRDAKDPQRMFNYWRTASTEQVALASRVPWVGRKGAFNSDPRWLTANSASHPYLEYDGGEMPQRQPFPGVPPGALQEALNASDDMKAIIGIYDASLGARSNETSGRAIMARQREGDVSTFHFIDNLSRAIKHAGRVLIDLIPAVYTGPRMVRIIGKEGGDPETVPVNRPVKQVGEGRFMPATEQEDADPGIPTTIFDLSAGRYDLTVNVGPSFTTKRQEAAEQMTELIRAFPQAAPLIGDLLAKNLDWPDADEIAKRLQAALPPSVAGDNPQVQQLTKQLQEIGQKFAALQGDKSLEAEKVKIDAFNAETNRLKAMGAAMQPEQVQALVVQTVQNLLASPDILPMPQQQPYMQGQ